MLHHFSLVSPLSALNVICPGLHAGDNASPVASTVQKNADIFLS